MSVYQKTTFNYYPKLITCVLLLIGMLFFLQNESKAQETDTLNEMVVSANRVWEKKKDIPQVIKIISNQIINDLKPMNTADLLEKTGSAFVQKSQQGGGSPVLRGFEANRILLVVDGIRMNNAIYRGGHLQNILRVDPFMLERVEIVYGPSSVLYGSDAMGGMVNMMTKRPLLNENFKGDYFYEFNSVNNGHTYHIDFKKGFKHFAFLTGVTYNDFGDLKQGTNRSNTIGNLGLRTIYQANLNGKDLLVKNNNPAIQVGSGYQQLDLFQSIIFQNNHSKKHLLNFQLSKSTIVPRYDRLSEVKNDTPVFGTWNYGPETRILLSYQYENKHKTLMADQLKWTSAYQWIEESRITRNFGKANENNRIEQVGVFSSSIDLFKQVNNHEIRYGIDMQWNKVNSTAFAKDINTLVQRPISTRYPDKGSSLLLSGIYISHSLELTRQFILTESIRLSSVHLKADFQNKDFYSFLPDQMAQNNLGVCGNLGLVWMPSKQLRLTAQTGNAFRAPNIDDINKIFDSQSGKKLIVPNSNLKPEIAWTSELGITFNPAPVLKINAQIFYTALSNAIVVSAFQINQNDSQIYDGKMTKTYAQQNKQLASIYGGSMAINYTFLTRLKLDAEITYTYGKINADSALPMDHIPPVFGRIGLQYQYKRFNCNIWSIFNGEKALKDYNLDGEDNFQYANSNGLPAWYTLNGQMGCFVDSKKRIHLNAGIENILDINYRTFSSGISAPGRNFKLGISVKI